MKKQTRRRRRKAASTPADPAKDGGGDSAERKAVEALAEAFSAASLDDVVSAYREAGCDSNKAAEILVQSLADAGAEDTCCSEEAFTTSSSSSSSGSSSGGVSGYETGSTSGSGSSEGFGSGSSEGFESGCVQNLVGERGFRNKQKRVVAAAGTVSTMLGKEYVRSRVTNLKGVGDGAAAAAAGEEEAEQFLCSMLGDNSELNLAVVRDVLCQCGYDVEKALDALLEVSSTSYERSSCSSNRSLMFKEDGSYSIGQFDFLTDRASDCTSYSSEDNIWYSGNTRRNYAEVLANPPLGPTTESNLPQKVLESLFNISKSPEYEPGAMNWKNVVNKLQTLKPEFDVSTSRSAESQQHTFAKGEEYHALRGTARQHWDTMKSYYQKAATAYSNGAREHAGYLSEQGKVQTKMALKADEKASQEIFKARNKDIENVITIDLHGQHVKQAMKLLKIHLLFGTYAQSVQFLRVITGCGSRGLGKSKLKQSVIQLVENEGITWSEENPGAVLIKLGSHTEFNFMDSESDAE